MDGGINDLLSAFLNNPEMIKKAADIMSAMSSGETKEQSAPPPDEAAAVPVMAKPAAAPAPVQDPPSNAANISNDQLAAMVSSVISALGMNGVPKSEPAQDTPPPVQQSETPPEDNAPPAAPASANFDIEKALSVLKNVSKETSPQKDNRVQLLLSLRPFMKDGRKQKIDMAVKYLNAAKVFNMFGKNGFI